MSDTAAKNQTNSSMYGLKLASCRGGLRVEEVLPLSVGHLLGFRRGWRITAVNGRPADAWALLGALSACFRQKEIALQVEVAKGKNTVKKHNMPCYNVAQSPQAQEKGLKVWETAGFEFSQFADTGSNAIYVSGIKPASRAEKAGFRLLDRVIYLNSEAFHTLDQLYEAILEADFMSFCVKSRCGNIRFVKQTKEMLLPGEGVVQAHEHADRGEDLASSYMGISLGNTYEEIRNVILPTKSGGTEIDHILVGPGGVFVAETKTLMGRLRGSAESGDWSRISHRGVREQIPNPVQQNRRHTEAVKAILKDLYGIEVPVFGVVVFIGTDFKVIPGLSDTPEVSTLDNFCEFVKSRTPVVGVDLAEKIVRIIRGEAVDSFRY
jgi:hypothetical protein